MTHTPQPRSGRSLPIRARLGVVVGLHVALVALVSLSVYLTLGNMERQATQALDTGQIELRSNMSGKPAARRTSRWRLAWPPGWASVC